MFNFGRKYDLIFTQKIPHWEIQKTTQRGQSGIRMGGMKAKRVKWQIRTRFGTAVVKMIQYLLLQKNTSMYTQKPQ